MEDFVFVQSHKNEANMYLSLLRRKWEQIRTRNEYDVGAVPRPFGLHFLIHPIYMNVNRFCTSTTIFF